MKKYNVFNLLLVLSIVAINLRCTPHWYSEKQYYPDDVYYSIQNTYPTQYYTPMVMQSVPYWMHPYEIHIYNNNRPTIPINKASSPRIVYQPKPANAPKKKTTTKSSPIRRFDTIIKNK